MTGAPGIDSRATFVIQFLAGAVCAPFLVTAIFRLVPFEWPLSTPFLVVLVLASALFFLRRPLRAVATGLVGGSIAWVIFLWWLIGQMD